MRLRYSHTLLLATCLWASSYFSSNAQCGLTVNAGEDIFVCNSGTPVNLFGQVIGDFSGVQWSPTGQVLFPNNINTIAIPTESPATFTLTAFGNTPTSNIIVNGDFSGGASGFTSSYSFGSGGPWGQLSNEGTYAVASNPNDTHTNFAPCSDHTGGGGNMMVVNGATTANQAVWCQTVAVDPNSAYSFSTWVTSVISSNPAILQFSINGQLLGVPFTAPGGTCGWGLFSESWAANGASSATICIVNQNTTPSGNDFALDDISFGPVCSQSDEVTVTVLELEANIAEPDMLPCGDGPATLTLDGSASTNGPNITYQWQTNDGNILSGQNTTNPTIDGPGTYTLTVSFNSGTQVCSATNAVQVTQNTDLPIANAAALGDLTCINMTTELSSAGSSNGANFQYEWTTQDGNLVSGQNTDMPLVDAAGTYTLTVTNTDNGCTATTTVMVNENMNEPTVIIFPPNEIRCNESEVLIDASNSDSGNNFNFFWTTSNGNFTSGENTLTPFVDGAGTYTLTIENLETGCTNSETVVVSGDAGVPVAEAGNPASIDCSTSMLELDGNGSSIGPDYTYQWQTGDGNIVSGDFTLNPTIDEVGTYTLTVTNTLNGCTSFDVVTISGDNTPPLAVVEMPEAIGCNTDNGIVLDASGSSSGTNFTYEWTTQDGNILSGETTSMPSVDAAGTYTFTVTNTENGCDFSIEVAVEENTEEPLILILPPDQISCDANEIIIDASESDNGNDYSFSWATADGNFISGENTLSPTVDVAGFYTLIIENLVNGCTSTEEIEVLGDASVPVAEAGNPMTLDCSVAALELDGNGSSEGDDYTYEWQTDDGNIVSGELSLNPEIDATGTYILTVTNNLNGCTAVDEVTIDGDNTPPLVIIEVPTMLTCATTAISINATNSDNGNDFSYQWTTDDGSIVDGENSLTLNIDATGFYTLTITNDINGCSTSETIEVLEDIVLPMVEIAPSEDFSCDVETLILDATTSSFGTQFSYEWTTEDGNIVSDEMSLEPTIDAPGNYVLTITNTNNGCSETSSITVAPGSDTPVADAGLAAEITCNAPTLTLDGSNSEMSDNLSYQWTTEDGNILDGENTLSPNIDAAGTYELTVLDNISGCSSTALVTITENNTAPTADAGIDDVLTCENEIANLDASNSSADNDFNLEWSTNDGELEGDTGAFFISTTTAGTYYLSVTDIINGCSALDSVVITANQEMPIADAGQAATLDCENTTLTLDGSNSSMGNDFFYQWTTVDGNIVEAENTLMPNIDAAGVYELIVTNTENGCMDSATVSIDESMDLPIAHAGQPNTLTCFTPELILDGSNSSIGNEFSYQWTTQDGNILENDTTLSPNINQAGTYQLTVFNNENNCMASAEVTIAANLETPIAEAGITQELSCSITELNLNGSGNANSNDLSYQWTTINGNIVNGATSTTPTINAPGIYTLEVMDNENGCTTTAAVQITQDANTPVANAGTAEDLTCVVTSLALDGSGSSMGNNFAYQWTSDDGNIVAGSNGLTPEINAAGTYVLAVTNTDNNCQTLSSITVLENTIPPIAHAGFEDNLTCTVNTLTLDGSFSDSGSDFTYEWTTQDGNILNGATTLMPTIDAIGTYQLMVTSSINGCSSTNTVMIGEDRTPPTAIANAPNELTCLDTVVNLSGMGSSTGNEFTYQWTSNEGNIVEGENTLTPLVDLVGTYELLITNSDNGCTETTTVLLTENITPPSVDAGANATLSCSENTLTLDGSNSEQNPNFSYQWTTDDGNILNGSSQLMPQINEPGTYELLITNLDNGCSATDAVLIESDDNSPTVLIATPGMLTCTTTELSIDASASDSNDDFNLSWTSPNGNIIANIQTLMPLVNQAGDYTLTITNLQNGCSENATVTVSQNTVPPTADAGNTFVLNCNLTQVTLNGNSDNTNNLQYQWTTSDGNMLSGENTLNPMINAEGTYQLQVTNLDNGCTAQDVVTITENIPNQFEYDIEPPNCVETTGVIAFGNIEGGQTPYTYSIDGGVTFSSQNLYATLEAGNYDLVIQDANACTLTETAHIPAMQELTISLETSAQLRLGEQYTIFTQTNIDTADIALIQWTPADSLSCSNCLYPVASPSETTIYQVYIEDINGCSAEERIELIVDKRPAVYIPNVFSPDKDGQNDIFYIFARDNSVKKVNSFQIYDRWGEIVFSDFNFLPNNPAHGWDGLLNGRTLNPAVFVYFAEIEMVSGEVVLFKGGVSLVK